ncbi:MAG TPA: phosphatidylcholine/phosphatidylserine synthase [Phycisphaerae bacterium]|nr:phosphatidylcholine/phosphatidylserine synthase [Phycisphaerae bacterium]HRR87085.1 phosphatidylcholine/phosphatidylserine synthase [Phycisphaerae bacterium]
MLKPVTRESAAIERRAARKRRRLRTIGMLPTLLTLGNLCFGFAAIHSCGRDLEEIHAPRSPDVALTFRRELLQKYAPSFLSFASWMIVGSLLCDALDGRVARKTGQASKFGEQLDSLADIVSFGVAPAVMMVTLVHREITQWGYAPLQFQHFGRLTLFVGIIYACCAALRLARFNVEASLDEAAHQGFKGLPSPGAAIAVISVVFLHESIDASSEWAQSANFLTKVLPFCTLVLALLMVSRLRYAHAANWLLRRRPLEHVILILLAFPLIWIYTELSLLVIAWAFALSGPARYVAGRLTGRAGRAAAAPATGLVPPSTDTEADKKAL